MLVSLVDGTQVPSDDPRWMRECEGRYVLRMTFAERSKFYELVSRMRGHAGLQTLQAMVFYLEPSFVLSLPTLAERREYAGLTADWFGVAARETLETRVRALWNDKKNERAVK